MMSQIITVFVCPWNDLSHSLFPPLIAMMPTGRRRPHAGLSLISKSSRHRPTVWDPTSSSEWGSERWDCCFQQLMYRCVSLAECWVSCCPGSQWLAQHLPGLKKWAEHMYLWWGMRWMVVGCVCPLDDAIQDPLWCPVGSDTAEGPCRAAAISGRGSLGLTKVQVASRTLASSELSSARLLAIWWLNKY